MNGRTSPQQSPLFRIVAFFSKRQFGYLVRRGRFGVPHQALFVFSAGAIALCIISAAARLTRMPLVFPPLAATAFILFNTPLSRPASPRSAVLSHTAGLITGIGSLLLLQALFRGGDLGAPDELSWLKVGSIALAMGLSGAVMIFGKFIHPPASATALIAAMGYIENIQQLLGFEFAVILLVAEAVLLNRFLGGIPYPYWRWREQPVQTYRVLAGAADPNRDFWRDTRARIHRNRE